MPLHSPRCGLSFAGVLTTTVILHTYTKQEASMRRMTVFHHPDRSGQAASNLDRSERNHQQDMNRVRQAAEALFAPRRQVTEPTAPVPVASTDQTIRKPRILSAVPAKPVPVEPVSTFLKVVSPSKRERIPTTHFARIRALLKYGMNISQVAELYGVPIGEIESMLKKA
jgi:hypothetical protein